MKLEYLEGMAGGLLYAEPALMEIIPWRSDKSGSELLKFADLKFC